MSPPGTPRGAPGATRGGPVHALAVTELLIRGATVVDPEGGVEPRSILVRGELPAVRASRVALRDADLVLVDLATTRPVDATRDPSVAGFSLGEGWPLRGWPVLTMVRGSIVMDKGEVIGKPGWGRYLPR